jgi:2-polyprenyl-3-methyl-5-hydroxy-6-metoxy-1,4-benzoquinol methylase
MTKSGRISSVDQVSVEADLARQLAEAPEEERHRLYGEIYDRVYEMHLSRSPETLEFGATPAFLPLLMKLTRREERVLEVGCGAGLLARELAKAGRNVIGIDVSNRILEQARVRAAGVPNLLLEHAEGVTLQYRGEYFDFAYSIEVVEHLHENDAIRHFVEVHRVLKPGGQYWFLTPNRLARITASERFGVDVDVDADVHLKEWTFGELEPVLGRAGFDKARVPFRDHRALRVPPFPLAFASAVERLPRRLRRRTLMRALGLNRCSVVASRGGDPV